MKKESNKTFARITELIKRMYYEVLAVLLVKIEAREEYAIEYKDCCPRIK